MNGRVRVAALFVGIAAGNAAAWVLLLHLAGRTPVLLSQGALAYVLGLRHGFDADHIAAIDNVTRKLSGERQRPLGVGLYFALGHSSIVTLLVLALVIGAPIVTRRIPAVEHFGGLIGALLSMAFLFFIAILNLVVLREVYHLLQAARRGRAPKGGDLAGALERRGLLTRLLGKVFRTVSRSWQMYPVGLLFGLGFDTATEVALLGMATLAALHQVPRATILILPLLFAAGMTLVDTTDGVLMATAYRWALASEVRKIHYNFVITLLSVVMALLVGTIEGLQVLGSQLHIAWEPWMALEHLSFGTLGMLIASAMVCAWGIGLIALRRRGPGRPGYPTSGDDAGTR